MKFLRRHLWSTFIFSVALLFTAQLSPAQVIYSNSGNNTTGFTDQFSSGTVTSNGTDIIEMNGGTWDTLPVAVTGNFQISFQVENNSYDGDADILLLNSTNNGGIDIRDSPQGTDTPSINIVSGTDFTNYYQFFFPPPSSYLASASTTNFPNLTWTPITISLNGSVLTDNVGGQIISANLSSVGLSSNLRLALGGYATSTYDPYPDDPSLPGQVLYRNIFVTVPEPSSWMLILAGASLLALARLDSLRFVLRES